MPTTTDNLKEAFAGESQANRKYLAYADAAVREGKPGVAKLFRAVAAAETIHAHAHLRALGGIKTTLDNLADAMDADGGDAAGGRGVGGRHEPGILPCAGPALPAKNQKKRAARRPPACCLRLGNDRPYRPGLPFSSVVPPAGPSSRSGPPGSSV